MHLLVYLSIPLGIIYLDHLVSVLLCSDIISLNSYWQMGNVRVPLPMHRPVGPPSPAPFPSGSTVSPHIRSFLPRNWVMIIIVVRCNFHLLHSSSYVSKLWFDAAITQSPEPNCCRGKSHVPRQEWKTGSSIVCRLFFYRHSTLFDPNKYF